MDKIGSKDTITSWSKTLKKGNMTSEIRVEKVMNGYVITLNKYGKPSSKEDYIDETKKYISKTNPLEDKVIVNDVKEGKESKKADKSEEQVNADILKMIQGDNFNF